MLSTFWCPNPSVNASAWLLILQAAALSERKSFEKRGDWSRQLGPHTLEEEGRSEGPARVLLWTLLCAERVEEDSYCLSLRLTSLMYESQWINTLKSVRLIKSQCRKILAQI